MKLPQGFDIKEQCPHGYQLVCKLQKSVYDLKQASRHWNTKFTETLLQFGIVQSKSNYSSFTIRTNHGFVFFPFFFTSCFGQPYGGIAYIFIYESIKVKVSHLELFNILSEGAKIANLKLGVYLHSLRWINLVRSPPHLGYH
ncbi:Uncharacterized protein TCM_013851 [Theobroma cacao]|uniref:Reverse transcriptase Ty1/copia-type domain-containing protein n=1 Tax=Theobroma cacao TaxID=3641 RepID=A0A061FXH5_THECC|nr:Uncharacterized protein TCM_013851 [Theobroma cacao]